VKNMARNNRVGVGGCLGDCEFCENSGVCSGNGCCGDCEFCENSGVCSGNKH
jgi:hypothetical protein